ncbi:MAG: precorrin-8X methylmutase [Thermodesulfobacteriota bacterium]
MDQTLRPDSGSLGPTDIEARSFAIIDSEVPEPRPFAGAQWSVVRRLIHTSADFEMLALARFSPGAVEAGMEALARCAAIVTDTEMCRAGITARRLAALGTTAQCFMGHPKVAEAAAAAGVTRARMAVDLAAEFFPPTRGPGPILAVGNAPTALLRILELVREGRLAPSLVVGMPVGFVNAAESKAMLLAEKGIPSIVIAGRKGGSSLAAATVNALAELALAGRVPAGSADSPE